MKQIHLLNDKIKKHEKDYISKEKIIREKEQIIPLMKKN